MMLMVVVLQTTSNMWLMIVVRSFSLLITTAVKQAIKNPSGAMIHNPSCTSSHGLVVDMVSKWSRP